MSGSPTGRQLISIWYVKCPGGGLTPPLLEAQWGVILLSLEKGTEGQAWRKALRDSGVSFFLAWRKALRWGAGGDGEGSLLSTS